MSKLKEGYWGPKKMREYMEECHGTAPDDRTIRRWLNEELGKPPHGKHVYKEKEAKEIVERKLLYRISKYIEANEVDEVGDLHEISLLKAARERANDDFNMENGPEPLAEREGDAMQAAIADDEAGLSDFHRQYGPEFAILHDELQQIKRTQETEFSTIRAMLRLIMRSQCKFDFEAEAYESDYTALKQYESDLLSFNEEIQNALGRGYDSLEDVLGSGYRDYENLLVKRASLQEKVDDLGNYKRNCSK